MNPNLLRPLLNTMNETTGIRSIFNFGSSYPQTTDCYLVFSFTDSNTCISHK